MPTQAENSRLFRKADPFQSLRSERLRLQGQFREWQVGGDTIRSYVVSLMALAR